MSNRVFWAASLIACSAVSVLAQAPSEEPEPAATSVIVNQQDKASAVAAAAVPTTVAYCGSQCGFIASTGNLYFTSSDVDEFGPDSASFYRISKTGIPGSEG